MKPSQETVTACFLRDDLHASAGGATSETVTGNA